MSPGKQVLIMSAPVALCLTIGRRPFLLRQTLESLLPLAKFQQIIAINDFGDIESNEVFKELCPSGILISLGVNMGHHRAVDAMYSKVETPYILHCEDDWLFESDLALDDAICLLQSTPTIGSVCLRKVSDFGFTEDEVKKTVLQEKSGVKYRRLDGMHDQWHGFTFNPHVISIDEWKKIGPYSNYKKERHISRKFRSLGKHVAYLEAGSCIHIGQDDSISNPRKTSIFSAGGFLHKLFKN